MVWNSLIITSMPALLYIISSSEFSNIVKVSQFCLKKKHKL